MSRPPDPPTSKPLPTMHYERTFLLQSAHFSAVAVYTAWRDGHTALDRAHQAAGEDDLASAFKFALEAAHSFKMTTRRSHGHNFRVIVKLYGMPPQDLDPDDPAYGCIVDDDDLRRVMSQFDNVNLSTLDHFHAERATTENLSRYIAQLLRTSFPNLWGVEVRVEENNQIAAHTHLSDV